MICECYYKYLVILNIIFYVEKYSIIKGWITYGNRILSRWENLLFLLVSLICINIVLLVYWEIIWGKVNLGGLSSYFYFIIMGDSNYYDLRIVVDV